MIDVTRLSGDEEGHVSVSVFLLSRRPPTAKVGSCQLQFLQGEEIVLDNFKNPSYTFRLLITS